MEKDILRPLRCLHGRLHEYSEKRKHESALRKSLELPTDFSVLIPGTPTHTNLGDSAIVIAQREFLQRCGIPSEYIREVTFEEYTEFRKTVTRSIRPPALITQLGGGNMGSQWLAEEQLHRKITQDFPQLPMIIFPQTIYYAPDVLSEHERLASIPIYNSHKSLTMVAREQRSFQIMGELYPNVDLFLVPDIVLSADMDVFGAKSRPRQGVLMCMRSDAERSMKDPDREFVTHMVQERGLVVRHTDMHSSIPVTAENRMRSVREKMEQIAGAQLMITDRLHGMIFAAITGTPCIVFSNYNHKVQGTYEWIQYLPYIRFAHTLEDAQKHLPELLDMRDCRYDKAPLEPYFKKLAEVVKKCL